MQGSIRRVAVIGAGTIGASWTALFLSRGFEVSATDPALEVEGRLRDFVAAAWPSLLRLAGEEPCPRAAPQERLTFHKTLEEAASGVEFVQENAPEREELKADLLRRLDGLLPPEVIIASSSSGLLITRLQAGCRHPERMIIGHPFNPPHLMPLVEVVAGERSEPALVARALNFYRSLGKRPIFIRREVKGHLANRLQAALWREAVHLLAEGVASAADIDTAISEGLGLRWALMGPNLVFHLAGGEGGIGHFLDQFAGPIAEWWHDLGRPELSAPVKEKIAAGVAAEAAGQGIGQLAARRDSLLVEILALKRSAEKSEREG